MRVNFLPSIQKNSQENMMWEFLWFFFLCWSWTPLSRAVTKKGQGLGFPLATISMTPGCILRKLEESKVEPMLSGHPRGTSKWRLNGGWPVNRGSSEISIIFSRNITLFETKAWLEKYYWSTVGHQLLSRTVFSFIIFLKWSQFKCIKPLMAS